MKNAAQKGVCLKIKFQPEYAYPKEGSESEMGLNMEEKQAATREYIPRCQRAAKKKKKALLDGFTKPAGCRRCKAGKAGRDLPEGQKRQN